MKKTILNIILCFTLLFSLTAFIACGGEDQETYVDQYTVKQVDVYREAGKVDKTIPLRFYSETPNVPYIGVDQYFSEFFKFDLAISKNGDSIKYALSDDAYMIFDAKQDILTVYNIDAFSEAEFFVSSTSKLFTEKIGKISTPMSEKVISLHNYCIDIHSGSEEVYVPLTLLSSLAGGVEQYNVAYNGNAVFTLDNGGSAYGEKRDHVYFGDDYLSPLYDTETKRPADLIEYTYNQLCFNFDNLRGYTVQLFMGDNNLLSLGLNGALERFYPEIKAALLSPDKAEYYAGFNTLMAVLYDGGHTASLINSESFMSLFMNKLVNNPTLLGVYREFLNVNTAKTLKAQKFSMTKNAALGVSGNYYLYDEATKTAFLGFDSFVLSPLSWDEYYLRGGEVPIDQDTYAYIRSKLYQALSDGAENLVLDLTTNGGGMAEALIGIFGLFNGGKATYANYNTFNKSMVSDISGIDIDLDGDFDDDDISETEKFKALNIGVLTSSYAFSCGNLLPCLLKEAGYKIIGEKTGGGSCTIKLETTADGLVYVHSSYDCIATNKGENVDSGVEPDFEISVYGEDGNFDMTKFYDFAYIAEYLSTAYSE